MARAYSSHLCGMVFLRILFLPAMIALLAIGCKPGIQVVQPGEKPDGRVVFNLSLTGTSTWCGGAEPPPWLLSELATPKALPSKKVYIRPGFTNDLSVPVSAEGVTDEQGVVSFSLKPGDYCLVFDNKKDSTLYKNTLNTLRSGTPDYSPVDPECLSRWLHTPELAFTLVSDTVDTVHNVFQYCPWSTIPCTQYTGPLPH